jgi:hypothetical protein
MPEPAFLVEGQMEQRIIQSLCPNKPVRLIRCNGDDVSMAAIARALNARLRLLLNYSPIIIILDRERRRPNKNAAQAASLGNSAWNCASDRALAIGCPVIAASRPLNQGRTPHIALHGTTQ